MYRGSSLYYLNHSAGRAIACQKGFEQGARKREKLWPSRFGVVCAAAVLTL